MRHHFPIPKCYFHASLVTCSLPSLLQTTGRYFSKISAIHRLNRLVLTWLKVLRIFIVSGFWPMRFSIATSRPHVVCLSSSSRSIFTASRNLFRQRNVQEDHCASRHVFTNFQGLIFPSEHAEMKKHRSIFKWI